MRLAILRAILAIVHWLEAPERRAYAAEQARIDALAEAEVGALGVTLNENGELSLSQKQRGVLLAMAESYYEIMKDSGAVNYWEVQIHSRMGSGIPPLVLTIQRKDGITPAGKAAAVTESLEQLLEAYREYDEPPGNPGLQVAFDDAAQLLEKLKATLPEPEKFDLEERLREYGESKHRATEGTEKTRTEESENES